MPTRQTKTLRECCQQDGMTADRGNSVLRGVKVIGYASKNGRRYTQESVGDALPLYEGVMVNIDHPGENPGQTRPVASRFGKLENVRQDAAGAWGDLRFNPHHPLAETVLWFAENMPGALGLSHNAVGQGTAESDGSFTVSKIISVRSVDLVSDPATTKGLYEAMEPELPTLGDDAGAGDRHEDHLVNAVSALLKDSALSPEAKKKKINAIMKILNDAGGDDDGGGDGGEEKPQLGNAEEGDLSDADSDEFDAAMANMREKGKLRYKESVRARDLPARFRQLTEELDRYRAKERLDANKTHARELCESAHLPGDLITDVFVDQLARQRDDKARKELIEDRRVLAGRKVTSAGKGNGGKRMDLNEFASALTGQE